MCNDFESQIKSIKQEQIKEKEKVYNHDQKIYEKDLEIVKVAEMKKQIG